MSRESPPNVDAAKLASTIREGGSWVAGEHHDRTPLNAVKEAPSWAASLSLILGLIAAVIGGVLFYGSPAFIVLLPISPLSAIGGLICARIARGSYPRGFPVRWPGRGMAFLGALLSGSVLVAETLLLIFFVIAFGTGEPMSGTNLP
jgi:hypothetical protein